MGNLASVLALIASQATGDTLPPADRSVYVGQVGEGNVAVIRQAIAHGTVRVEQDGVGNTADITQSAAIADGQTDMLTGDEGEASISVHQDGGGNSAQVRQFSTQGALNTAILSQRGSGNVLSLQQVGTGNEADFEQTGSGNTMNARQLGNDNALRWSQTGNGLPDLGITQTGGQSIAISQSGSGK